MGLTFSGSTTNYAQTAISFSAGKGTVMGWVRLASDRNDYSTFFQTNAIDNAQFVCQTNSTGTELSVYIYNSSNTGSGLTVGAWYHVAMTWDGSTARVYLNGTLNASVSATGSTWNEVELGRSYWGEPLDGNIAHIKAWDATLSQAEIAAEKDVIAAVRGSNLIGEWQTPAGANRLLDTSGNGNHLTGFGTITDYANPLAAITVTDAGSGSDAVTVDTGATYDNEVTLPDVAIGLDSLSIIKSPYYVNSATSFSGSGVTSRTCDVPSGTQDGDLMLAVVMVELASASVTANAAWGSPILNTALSTRTHTQVVYARIANSEPANYTFSWASAECGVAIITYRNAALSSLYNSQVNNSTTTTCTAPSLTTVSPNSLSVWIGTIMYGTTWTPPANYGERVDQRTSTASTNMAMGIADRVIVTPGATGAIAGTAANGDYNVGAHIILVPAARTLAIVDTGHGVDAVAATETSGDQTITVTDTGSGVDALAGVAVALALSDAGAGNDAFGAAATLAATDTGTGSDSIAQMLASLLLSESGAGSDALAGLTVALTAADSGAGSDAIANLAASVTAADAGSGADTLASLAAALGVADTGSGADTLTGLTAALGVSDAGAGADALASLAAALGVADTGSGADALAEIAAALGVSDTAAGTDALASLASAMGVADTGAGTDALGNLAASLSVADSGVGVDSPVISVTLSVADAGMGTDAILQLILIAIADAGTAVDSLSSIAVALTLPDSGAGSEALSIQVAVNLADAGSGDEAINLLTEALKQVLDSGVGTDLVLSPAVSLAVLDGGVGADAAAVSVTVTVADSGSAVEALSVIATMLVSILDSGSGSDALAVSVAPIVVADTGSGSDAPGIAVALTLADVAAGSDALLTSVLVTVADTAAGTDTLGSITVNVPVSDMGQAVDVLGQVNAVLSVLDVGAGVDVLVRYDSAVKLVKVVFVLARRAMAFAWRARSVGFAWSLRTVEFAGPAPSIEFAWSRRTIEFVINS